MTDGNTPKRIEWAGWAGVLLTALSALLAITVQWGVVNTKLDNVEKRLDEMIFEARALRSEYQSRFVASSLRRSPPPCLRAFVPPSLRRSPVNPRSRGGFHGWPRRGRVRRRWRWRRRTSPRPRRAPRGRCRA
jgi:hypothetical protein